MHSLSGSEMLFGGGIIIMTAAVVCAAAGIIVFRLTGKKIRQKLEQEYGRPHR